MDQISIYFDRMKPEQIIDLLYGFHELAPLWQRISLCETNDSQRMPTGVPRTPSELRAIIASNDVISVTGILEYKINREILEIRIYIERFQDTLYMLELSMTPHCGTWQEIHKLIKCLSQYADNDTKSAYGDHAYNVRLGIARSLPTEEGGRLHGLEAVRLSAVAEWIMAWMDHNPDRLM